MFTLQIVLHFSHCIASCLTGNEFALPNKVGSIICLECFNATDPGLDKKSEFWNEGRVCTADITFQLSIRCHLQNLVEPKILPLDARD